MTGGGMKLRQAMNHITDRIDTDAMARRVVAVIDAFFDWHRRHNVTGVEVMHIPLLAISIIVLANAGQRERAVGLFHALDVLVPLDLWAAALAFVAVTLFMSLMLQRLWLHRWMLGLTASWWFLVALLIWKSGSTWLTPSIYTSIGLSALYRVAEQSFRETVERHE